MICKKRYTKGRERETEKLSKRGHGGRSDPGPKEAPVPAYAGVQGSLEYREVEEKRDAQRKGGERVGQGM